jgi:fumarate hydratase subunit beta
LGDPPCIGQDNRRRCHILPGGEVLKTLNTPLSEETVRSLELGETIFLNGLIITGRDEMHIRALDYVKEGKAVPADIDGSVLFHCGPIMVQREDGSWAVIAAGPTTSARMNKLEPEFIRKFHIRAIIGKGGMSKDTAEAMKECGCVYLAATGGAAISLAEGLRKCVGQEWLDLGMAEAMWRFDAEKFGPLVVAIDAKGNSLYDKVNASLVRP